jgi:hypothetical protein
MKSPGQQRMLGISSKVFELAVQGCLASWRRPALPPLLPTHCLSLAAPATSFHPRLHCCPPLVPISSVCGDGGAYSAGHYAAVAVAVAVAVRAAAYSSMCSQC